MYKQQKRLLHALGDKNTCPKKRWCKDMLLQVEKWINQGADILLGVDANSALEEDTFGNMVSRLGLIDLIAMKNGHEQQETFKLGDKTVDFLLGTRRVADALRKSGWLAFDNGVLSDHRGGFADFETNSW